MSVAREAAHRTFLQHLLEDIEETLESDGWASLYEFSWILRGLEEPPAEDDIERVVIEAYAEINRRLQLSLVWMGWPEANIEDVVDGEEPDCSMCAAGRHMVLVGSIGRHLEEEQSRGQR